MPVPLRALLLAALAATPVAARAQVGYPPSASPYRDIPRGHTITATGGWLGGTGGSLHLGPHSGATYGARYDVRTNAFLQLGLDVEHGTFDRFIVDPFVRLADRTRGPVRQSLTFVEASLQFNLTGNKSWNHIAPFFATGLGVAFASPSVAPGDSSGYKFKNKFYFAPTIGTRIFFGSRLHLRAEARALVWRLNYPGSFTSEPRLEPGTNGKSNAVIQDNHLNEWTPTPWLRVGLGFSFRP
jgi:hypothetical protein